MTDDPRAQRAAEACILLTRRHAWLFNHSATEQAREFATLIAAEYAELVALGDCMADLLDSECDIGDEWRALRGAKR
jgi:hypothetical protein